MSCCIEPDGGLMGCATVVDCRGGRSHFFRLRLGSCSKIFESWSGNSSNLKIRLLFKLRLQSLIQQKFTHVFP